MCWIVFLLGCRRLTILQNLAKIIFAVKCMVSWLCQPIFIFFVISSKVFMIIQSRHGNTRDICPIGWAMWL